MTPVADELIEDGGEEIILLDTAVEQLDQVGDLVVMILLSHRIRSLTRRAGDERALEALALQTLALQLTGAAHGLGTFAGTLFRRLLVITTKLHLAEYALTLHFLLESLQRLIDIIVTNENLHVSPPLPFRNKKNPTGRTPVLPKDGIGNTSSFGMEARL
jgi:hypothetical protein